MKQIGRYLIRYADNRVYDLGLKSTLKFETIFGNWKLFKNDEKYLFYLKISFRSQSI